MEGRSIILTQGFARLYIYIYCSSVAHIRLKKGGSENSSGKSAEQRFRVSEEVGDEESMVCEWVGDGGGFGLMGLRWRLNGQAIHLRPGKTDFKFQTSTSHKGVVVQSSRVRDFSALTALKLSHWQLWKTLPAPDQLDSTDFDSDLWLVALVLQIPAAIDSLSQLR